MANSNTTRRYMPAELGPDKANKPHGFHVEGFVSRDAHYVEATGDKKSFLATAIGINMNPERMMALADGTFDKNADYGEPTGFLSLKIFGKTAEEFSKICTKGVKVAVSGNLEWRTYPKKDGSGDAKELVMNVNSLVVMGGKNIAPVISDNIGVSTRVWTGKDSVAHSQSVAELVTGRVVGCNGLKTTEGGKNYLTFGVLTKLPAEKIYDLTAGTYKKDKEYDAKKCIINVSLFDKQAEALSKVIRDGAEVVVTGPVEAREYEGSISYRMRARVCSVMKFAPQAEGAAPAPAPASAEEVNTAGFSVIADDDDDGDLPF